MRKLVNELQSLRESPAASDQAHPQVQIASASPEAINRALKLEIRRRIQKHHDKKAAIIRITPRQLTSHLPSRLIKPHALLLAFYTS